MTTSPTQGEHAQTEALQDGITLARLKELLHYDPETGVFTWRSAARGLVRKGDTAGSLWRNGYVYITVAKNRYRAHRLAWFYVHGVWPAGEIDHINRITHDNRIANLREATRAENNQNRQLQRNNKSGYRGVSKRKRAELWTAKIYSNKQCRWLGSFTSPELAYAAYQAASQELHTHRAEGTT